MREDDNLVETSIDSGICLDTSSGDQENKLKTYQRILFLLDRDQRLRAEQRKRLSQISEKKLRKKLNEEPCNVCCINLDVENIKICIKCINCQKIACRGQECSTWIPSQSGWECKLCNQSNESCSKSSEWLHQQITGRFLSPINTKSEPSLLRDHHPLEFDRRSETTSSFGVDKKERVRQLVEEILGDMLGGSLDNVSISQLYKSREYLPTWENGESPGVSHVKLKRLIERIIQETLRLPTITDQPNHPGPSDDGDLPFFDPKKYQELLATAVLNKIVDSYNYEKKFEGNRESASTRSDLDKNHNALIGRKEQSGSISSSSIEPESDCSITDPPTNISRCGDFSRSDSGSNIFSDILNRNDLNDSSILNDYLAKHKVPLPDFSIGSDSSNEDLPDNANTKNIENSWERNWLFKKKRSGQDGSGPVGMLVPCPKEDVKTLIGDRTADEMSDLSEAGSDFEDKDREGNIENPQNVRIQNRNVIGGKSPIGIFDELLEQTSLMSTSSLADGDAVFTETKNDFVLGDDLHNNLGEPSAFDPDEAINSLVDTQNLRNNLSKSATTNPKDDYTQSHYVNVQIERPPIALPRSTNKTIYISTKDIPETQLTSSSTDSPANNNKNACESTTIPTQTTNTTNNNNIEEESAQLLPLQCSKPSAIHFLAVLSLAPSLAIPVENCDDIIRISHETNISQAPKFEDSFDGDLNIVADATGSTAVSIADDKTTSESLVNTKDLIEASHPISDDTKILDESKVQIESLTKDIQTENNFPVTIKITTEIDSTIQAIELKDNNFSTELEFEGFIPPPIGFGGECQLQIQCSEKTLIDDNSNPQNASNLDQNETSEENITQTQEETKLGKSNDIEEAVKSSATEDSISEENKEQTVKSAELSSEISKLPDVSRIEIVQSDETIITSSNLKVEIFKECNASANTENILSESVSVSEEFSKENSKLSGGITINESSFLQEEKTQALTEEILSESTVLTVAIAEEALPESATSAVPVAEEILPESKGSENFRKENPTADEITRTDPPSDPKEESIAIVEEILLESVATAVEIFPEIKSPDSELEEIITHPNQLQLLLQSEKDESPKEISNNSSLAKFITEDKCEEDCHEFHMAAIAAMLQEEEENSSIVASENSILALDEVAIISSIHNPVEDETRTKEHIIRDISSSEALDYIPATIEINSSDSACSLAKFIREDSREGACHEFHMAAIAAMMQEEAENLLSEVEESSENTKIDAIPKTATPEILLQDQCPASKTISSAENEGTCEEICHEFHIAAITAIMQDEENLLNEVANDSILASNESLGHTTSDPSNTEVINTSAANIEEGTINISKGNTDIEALLKEPAPELLPQGQSMDSETTSIQVAAEDLAFHIAAITAIMQAEENLLNEVANDSILASNEAMDQTTSDLSNIEVINTLGATIKEDTIKGHTEIKALVNEAASELSPQDQNLDSGTTSIEVPAEDHAFHIAGTTAVMQEEEHLLNEVANDSNLASNEAVDQTTSDLSNTEVINTSATTIEEDTINISKENTEIEALLKEATPELLPQDQSLDSETTSIQIPAEDHAFHIAATTAIMQEEENLLNEVANDSILASNEALDQTTTDLSNTEVINTLGATIKEDTIKGHTEIEALLKEATPESLPQDQSLDSETTSIQEPAEDREFHIAAITVIMQEEEHLLNEVANDSNLASNEALNQTTTDLSNSEVINTSAANIEEDTINISKENTEIEALLKEAAPKLSPQDQNLDSETTSIQVPAEDSAFHIAATTAIMQEEEHLLNEAANDSNLASNEALDQTTTALSNTEVINTSAATIEEDTINTSMKNTEIEAFLNEATPELLPQDQSVDSETTSIQVAAENPAFHIAAITAITQEEENLLSEVANDSILASNEALDQTTSDLSNIEVKNTLAATIKEDTIKGHTEIEALLKEATPESLPQDQSLDSETTSIQEPAEDHEFHIAAIAVIMQEEAESLLSAVTNDSIVASNEVLNQTITDLPSSVVINSDNDGRAASEIHSKAECASTIIETTSADENFISNDHSIDDIPFTTPQQESVTNCIAETVSNSIEDTKLIEPSVSESQTETAKKVVDAPSQDNRECSHRLTDKTDNAVDISVMEVVLSNEPEGSHCSVIEITSENVAPNLNKEDESNGNSVEKCEENPGLNVDSLESAAADSFETSIQDVVTEDQSITEVQSTNKSANIEDLVESSLLTEKTVKLYQAEASITDIAPDECTLENRSGITEALQKITESALNEPAIDEEQPPEYMDLPSIEPSDISLAYFQEQYLKSYTPRANKNIEIEENLEMSLLEDEKPPDCMNLTSFESPPSYEDNVLNSNKCTDYEVFNKDIAVAEKKSKIPIKVKAGVTKNVSAVLKNDSQEKTSTPDKIQSNESLYSPKTENPDSEFFDIDSIPPPVEFQSKNITEVDEIEILESGAFDGEGTEGTITNTVISSDPSYTLESSEVTNLKESSTLSETKSSLESKLEESVEQLSEPIGIANKVNHQELIKEKHIQGDIHQKVSQIKECQAENEGSNQVGSDMKVVESQTDTCRAEDKILSVINSESETTKKPAPIAQTETSETIQCDTSSTHFNEATSSKSAEPVPESSMKRVTSEHEFIFEMESELFHFAEAVCGDDFEEVEDHFEDLFLSHESVQIIDPTKIGELCRTIIKESINKIEPEEPRKMKASNVIDPETKDMNTKVISNTSPKKKESLNLVSNEENDEIDSDNSLEIIDVVGVTSIVRQDTMESFESQHSFAEHSLFSDSKLGRLSESSETFEENFSAEANTAKELEQTDSSSKENVSVIKPVITDNETPCLGSQSEEIIDQTKISEQEESVYNLSLDISNKTQENFEVGICSSKGVKATEETQRCEGNIDSEPIEEPRTSLDSQESTILSSEIRNEISSDNTPPVNEETTDNLNRTINMQDQSFEILREDISIEDKNEIDSETNYKEENNKEHSEHTLELHHTELQPSEPDVINSAMDYSFGRETTKEEIKALHAPTETKTAYLKIVAEIPIDQDQKIDQLTALLNELISSTVKADSSRNIEDTQRSTCEVAIHKISSSSNAPTEDISAKKNDMKQLDFSSIHIETKDNFDETEDITEPAKVPVELPFPETASASLGDISDFTEKALNLEIPKHSKGTTSTNAKETITQNQEVKATLPIVPVAVESSNEIKQTINDEKRHQDLTITTNATEISCEAVTEFKGTTSKEPIAEDNQELETEVLFAHISEDESSSITTESCHESTSTIEIEELNSPIDCSAGTPLSSPIASHDVDHSQEDAISQVIQRIEDIITAEKETKSFGKEAELEELDVSSKKPIEAVAITSMNLGQHNEEAKKPNLEVEELTTESNENLEKPSLHEVLDVFPGEGTGGKSSVEAEVARQQQECDDNVPKSEYCEWVASVNIEKIESVQNEPCLNQFQEIKKGKVELVQTVSIDKGTSELAASNEVKVDDTDQVVTNDENPKQNAVYYKAQCNTDYDKLPGNLKSQQLNSETMEETHSDQQSTQKTTLEPNGTNEGASHCSKEISSSSEDISNYDTAPSSLTDVLEAAVSSSSEELQVFSDPQESTEAANLAPELKVESKDESNNDFQANKEELTDLLSVPPPLEFQTTNNEDNQLTKNESSQNVVISATGCSIIVSEEINQSDEISLIDTETVNVIEETPDEITSVPPLQNETQTELNNMVGVETQIAINNSPGTSEELCNEVCCDSKLVQTASGVVNNLQKGEPQLAVDKVDNNCKSSKKPSATSNPEKLLDELSGSGLLEFILGETLDTSSKIESKLAVESHKSIETDLPTIQNTVDIVNVDRNTEEKESLILSEISEGTRIEEQVVTKSQIDVIESSQIGETSNNNMKISSTDLELTIPQTELSETHSIIESVTRDDPSEESPETHISISVAEETTWSDSSGIESNEDLSIGVPSCEKSTIIQSANSLVEEITSPETSTELHELPKSKVAVNLDFSNKNDATDDSLNSQNTEAANKTCISCSENVFPSETDESLSGIKKASPIIQEVSPELEEASPKMEQVPSEIEEPSTVIDKPSSELDEAISGILKDSSQTNQISKEQVVSDNLSLELCNAVVKASHSDVAPQQIIVADFIQISCVIAEDSISSERNSISSTDLESSIRSQDEQKTCLDTDEYDSLKIYGEDKTECEETQSQPQPEPQAHSEQKNEIDLEHRKTEPDELEDFESIEGNITSESNSEEHVEMKELDLKEKVSCITDGSDAMLDVCELDRETSIETTSLEIELKDSDSLRTDNKAVELETSTIENLEENNIIEEVIDLDVKQVELPDEIAESSLPEKLETATEIEPTSNKCKTQWNFESLKDETVDDVQKLPEAASLNIKPSPDRHYSQQESVQMPTVLVENEKQSRQFESSVENKPSLGTGDSVSTPLSVDIKNGCGSSKQENDKNRLSLDVSKYDDSSLEVLIDSSSSPTLSDDSEPFEEDIDSTNQIDLSEAESNSEVSSTHSNDTIVESITSLPSGDVQHNTTSFPTPTSEISALPVEIQTESVGKISALPAKLLTELSVELGIDAIMLADLTITNYPSIEMSSESPQDEEEELDEPNEEFEEGEEEQAEYTPDSLEIEPELSITPPEISLSYMTPTFLESIPEDFEISDSPPKSFSENIELLVQEIEDRNKIANDSIESEYQEPEETTERNFDESPEDTTQQGDIQILPSHPQTTTSTISDIDLKSPSVVISLSADRKTSTESSTTTDDTVQSAIETTKTDINNPTVLVLHKDLFPVPTETYSVSLSLIPLNSNHNNTNQEDSSTANEISNDSTTSDATTTLSNGSSNKLHTKLDTLKYPAFSTQLSDEEDVVGHLSHLMPGSIAEREHKKWYNAVDMPNNPYSKEALKRRLSGTSDKPIDIPNMNSAALEKTSSEDPLNGGNDENEINIDENKLDYKRYGRDYYINCAKHASGTNKRNLAASTSFLTCAEDDKFSDKELSPPPTPQPIPRSHSWGDKRHDTADIFAARPVRVEESDPILSKATKLEYLSTPDRDFYLLPTEEISSLRSISTSEHSLSQAGDSLTPSEDSDTIRVYDLKTQETRLLLRDDQVNSPQTGTNTSGTSAIQGLRLPLITSQSTQSFASPRLVKNRAVTPSSLRFLQPKRKLFDSRRIMSEDNATLATFDRENSLRSNGTPEKNVIEEDVISSLPSVKALARAFQNTSQDSSAPVNRPKSTSWKSVDIKSNGQPIVSTTNDDEKSEPKTPSRDSYSPSYDQKYVPAEPATEQKVNGSCSDEHVSENQTNVSASSAEETTQPASPQPAEPVAVVQSEPIAENFEVQKEPETEQPPQTIEPVTTLPEPVQPELTTAPQDEPVAEEVPAPQTPQVTSLTVETPPEREECEPISLEWKEENIEMVHKDTLPVSQDQPKEGDPAIASELAAPILAEHYATPPNTPNPPEDEEGEVPANTPTSCPEQLTVEEHAKAVTFSEPITPIAPTSIQLEPKQEEKPTEIQSDASPNDEQPTPISPHPTQNENETAIQNGSHDSIATPTTQEEAQIAESPETPAPEIPAPEIPAPETPAPTSLPLEQKTQQTESEQSATSAAQNDEPKTSIVEQKRAEIRFTQESPTRERPISPVLVPGKLKSSIAFFENLRNK